MVDGAATTETIAVAIGEIRPLLERIATAGRLAGTPEAVVDELCLCLDELLTNVVMHSGLDAGATISVGYSLSADRVSAEIVDPGRPFDPLSLPAPDTGAALDERNPGGLGIHFLRTLMDEVRYERVGDRNRLRFSKRIAAGARSTPET